jgi:hypothetical protein
VGYALTNIFIIIIGEDWNWSMYEWVRAYGHGSGSKEVLAIFFYLLLMIMGNVVLFSLFTAVLLRNFEGGDEDEEEEEAEGGEEDEELSFAQKIKSKEFWSDLFEKFKEAFGQRKRINTVLDAQGEELYLKLETGSQKSSVSDVSHVSAQPLDDDSILTAKQIQKQIEKKAREMRRK